MENTKQQVDKTQDGKEIITTEHADGRKDVTIKVNMLNVKENDPATLKAKKHIEDVIIPELANQKVLVIVVHKPDNIFAQKLVKATDVRVFAEAAVKMHGGKPEDYVIVEHNVTNNTVQVSSL